MIKIAYIIDSIESPTAGTELQLLMLLNELNRQEFEPHLVCLHDSDWMRQQSFDFPVKKFSFARVASLDFIRNMRALARYFKEQDFDIVQTFFKDGNIYGTVAARMAGRKIIISSRRNIGYWHDAKQLAILRFLRRWTSWYLSNSQVNINIVMDTEKADPSKIKVIYNGLDLEKFTSTDEEMRKRRRAEWGIADDEILIGMVVNLRPVKNVELFIESASDLLRNYPKLKFVVIGEGPLRPRYEEKICSSGLENRFLLPGKYLDVAGCLAAFDIAAICSKSESFSNSLIEYMAARLPIVASDVGGNSEAIDHEENGLLFSLEDAGGLNKSIKRYLDDPEFAREMGKRAQKKALENYKRDVCIQNHESFYKSIVKG
jgi:glycosyltransferase involved in cell wall biosynthesis